MHEKPGARLKLILTLEMDFWMLSLDWQVADCELCLRAHMRLGFIYSKKKLCAVAETPKWRAHALLKWVKA